MKLFRLIVYVADPIRCAEFYRDHFGLTKIAEWDSEWAELDGDGMRLGFHRAFDGNGPIQKPTGSQNNPHKISFLVQDVEASRKKLIESGISISEIKNFGGWIMCNGTDVEGHVFQLTNR